MRYLDVEELTAHLNVHHNAVRQHLAVLVEAGLILARRERRTLPGRPRLLYSINPGVSGLWGTGNPYRTIVLWLVEMIKSGRSAREVGREAGLKRAKAESYQGMELVGVLNSDLAVGGYSPRDDIGSAGPAFILEVCPFAEAASQDPTTICELHRGLLEGLVEGVVGNGASVSLLAKDPAAACCRVALSGPAEIG